jgi:PAS domain S-box-containing protein
MAHMNWTRWALAYRYGGAAVIVGIAAVIRTVLPLDSAPFLLYMPAIFAISLLFGKGPGFAATIVSAAIAMICFMSRARGAALSWDELVGTVLFTMISLALAAVCDSLGHTLRRREADFQATLAAKQALEASESFLRSVLASSPDCIKILDLDARLTMMNEGGQQIMEVDDFSKIENCPWPDFWQGEHNAVAHAAIAQAKAGKVARFQGFCETVAGTPKWWDVSVTPIMRDGDVVERLLVTSRDITEQKRADAQQRLLNHELGHRLKNMLAMIQAVANQTLKRADNLDDARASFDSRLVALGKAQDVLTGMQWESADINAVIRNALAPHGIDLDRFVLKGLSLMLSSRCALALSLALHELATNAAKYGALSIETGSVALTWGIRQESGGLRFYIEWHEEGGPPVQVPERAGFGSFMIERSLSGYFRGSARIEYAPTGVIFVLDAPATRVEREFHAGDVDILVSKANIN